MVVFQLQKCTRLRSNREKLLLEPFGVHIDRPFEEVRYSVILPTAIFWAVGKLLHPILGLFMEDDGL